MSTKNVYKIGKIHQLFDLSTDSINFTCNFKIQAEKSDNEFEYLVVSQEQLDSDDKLKFNKVKGIGSGKIVADKGVKHNLFLALKSKQEMTVTVETVFENLPDNIDNTFVQNFIPSDTYTGPIRGMVFQSGPQGNGYYPDPTQSIPTPTESTPTESTPTESTPTESTPTESTPTESTHDIAQQNYIKYIEQLQQQLQQQQEQHNQQLQQQQEQHNQQLQQQEQFKQVENTSFFSNMLNNKYVWIITGIVFVMIVWYVFSSQSANSVSKDSVSKDSVSKDSANSKDSVKSLTKLSSNNSSVTQTKKSSSKHNKLNIDKLNSLN